MTQPASALIPAPPAEQRLPSDVLINGGKDLIVTLRDGTTKTIKVRLVPLSECFRYYETLGEMAHFIDFITGEKPGFADSLADDDAFEIDRVAKELNDFRARRFLVRQKATHQALNQQAGNIVSSSSLPTA